MLYKFTHSETVRKTLLIGVVLFASTVNRSIIAEDAPFKTDVSLADLIESKDYAAAFEKIQAGEDVNQKQADEMTPLHWAVYHGHNALTDKLLAVGANPDPVNRYGVPPLWIACRNGDSSSATHLLNAGAEPNFALRGGETMLMTASRTGSAPIVQSLLDHGAIINAQEQNKQTALMWAAAEGNLDAVDTLIRNGADVHLTLDSGFNAFYFAVREGFGEVAFRLVEAGIDTNARMKPKRKASKGPSNGMNALLLAIENGHFELAKQLVCKGADPNSVTTGYAPLHAITWVRKPIRGDGDPPPTGSGTLTSLELVKFLIEQGADVNIRHRKHSARGSGLNRTDATPILLAAETGDLPFIKLLIQHGADPQSTNVDHVTPLLAASGIGVLSNGDESAGTEKDAINTIRFLIDAGAEINSVDDQGKTVMHGAAFKSWPNLINSLHQWGADPKIWNTKNSDGWTPLMIAEGNRPGNFRPSQPTIDAIEELLRIETNSNVDPAKIPKKNLGNAR